MNLFVTGATGFIGSHFLNQALLAGHTVVGLRRSVSSNPRIPVPVEPKWITKSMDSLNVNDFQGIDCLVHLAAHGTTPPHDTLESCLYWNLTVPLTMTRYAHAAGVKRFIVAGSCFEYGRSGERYDEIPIDAPLEPTSTYSVSKATASIAFGYLALELKVAISIHRIFQVYGEGEAHNRFWPSLRRAALAGEDFPMTSGEQIRDFIAVEAVASRLIKSLESVQVEPGCCRIENLGTGKPQALRDFARHWWETQWNAPGKLLLGAIPHRDHEIMRYVPLVDATNVF